MSTSKRKSRIICFRLSPEEHDQFRQLCIQHSVQSISDLARTGLYRLREDQSKIHTVEVIADNEAVRRQRRAQPIRVQIARLRSQLAVLSEEVNLLAGQLEGPKPVLSRKEAVV
jgi:hypothetical protein